MSWWCIDFESHSHLSVLLHYYTSCHINVLCVKEMRGERRRMVTGKVRGGAERAKEKRGLKRKEKKESRGWLERVGDELSGLGSNTV